MMSGSFQPVNINETIAHWKVTRVDSSPSCNPRHSIHVTAEEPPMTTTTARGAALARTATGPGTGNAAPRRRRRPRSDLRVALFFIAPALLGFVAFYLVPSIRGVYLSFTAYSVLGDPTWIGTKNYTAIFADDLFWNAMAVTVQYVALNIGFQTAIAPGLALLMHNVAKSTLIRGALLLPFLVANVIVA